MLWFRHSFFEHFFFMFCLSDHVYKYVLSDWIEEVLNSKITLFVKQDEISPSVLDSLLKCKVNISDHYDGPCSFWIECLNLKISSLEGHEIMQICEVEDALTKLNVDTLDDMYSCDIYKSNGGEIYNETNKIDRVLGCIVNEIGSNSLDPVSNVKDVLESKLTDKEFVINLSNLRVLDVIKFKPSFLVGDVLKYKSEQVAENSDGGTR